MKKLFYILILIGAMPLSMMAQDDDLYFTPKAKQDVCSDNGGSVYYSGSDRDVDEYNRNGYNKSYYQIIGNDSLGNDIIEFDDENGTYPDNSSADTVYVYSNPLQFDEYNYFTYGHHFSRFDGWYCPWYYGTYGYSPFLYSRWGSYYDPFYAPYYSWYGFTNYGWGFPYDYGWYDNWYYGWNYGYSNYIRGYYTGGHNNYRGINSRNHYKKEISFGHSNYGDSRTNGTFSGARGNNNITSSRVGRTDSSRSNNNGVKFGGSRSNMSTSTSSRDSYATTRSNTSSNFGSNSTSSFGGNSSRGGSFSGGSPTRGGGGNFGGHR